MGAGRGRSEKFFFIVRTALKFTFFSPGLQRTTSISASLGMKEWHVAESMEKAGAGESADSLMDPPHKIVCKNTHQHMYKCI